MKRPLIVGVMGGGSATKKMEEEARRLGALIAQKGWVLLNGGRNAGIMEASAKGAAENGGITIGILPDSDPAKISDHIRIPIITEMGFARNCINILSSNVVVACPGGPGTLSEIALALKYKKPVILLNFDPGTGFEQYIKEGLLRQASSPEEAIDMIG